MRFVRVSLIERDGNEKKRNKIKTSASTLKLLTFAIAYRRDI